MGKALMGLVILSALFSTSMLASISWDFASGPGDLSPSAPPGAEASAVIRPGALGEGWQNTWNTGATGYWDLGTGSAVDGQMVLHVSALPVGTTLSTLSVRQWIDSSTTLNGALTVSGATFASPQPMIYPVPSLAPVLSPGGWQEFLWQFTPGTGLGDITITAPGTGAIIERVTLETSVASAVPEPATLMAGALLLLPLGLSTLRILRRT